MDCASCGHDNPERARFCLECGKPFLLRCSSCATELPAGAKFCLECGAPTSGPSTERPASRSPSDYTPKHLADKILLSKSALEGELKQVTVLFADIQGSMELAETLGAERWHSVLDRFFSILTKAIHHFEGTVNQYTGDGIMALFGAPIAHEDHSQRAARAALEVLEQLAPLARKLESAHSITLSARIGLNSGEVVVGRIGDDLRMDYTAQGHTVGLAQRLESLASPDTIYVSEATARLLGSLFELEDLGRFQLKGSRDHERVFRLLGEGRHQTRFDQSQARGLSRFVGREADTRHLEEALAQAKEGNGQVVGIVAEAGTGKSRLCFEFVERCRREGLTVSVGRALAHGRDIPLLPILQAFRSYYGVEDHDEPRQVREKIGRRMVRHDASFEEDLPLLFEFFGAPDPQRPAVQMDGDARQRRLFEILRRTTRLSAGDGHATVVLIEDLHWLDSASEDFLAQWVDATAGTHTLLLLNFRPEYQPEWIGRAYYRQMPLSPLDQSSIGELMEDLIGHDSSTRGLAERIHQRTRGNPFFAEEILQSLIEAGRLIGSRGSYRLDGAVDELTIPETVQAVLASRIDRLAEQEKSVLQAASVIGKEFAEPVLRQVTGLSDVELASSLRQLARAEFVREAETQPVLGYVFKHPLTQEVALGSQLREHRQKAHAETAAAMRHFFSEQLDEKAALIAHHLEEAGESLDAATWHSRAARWTRRTDWRQGNRHSRRVLTLAQADDSSPEVCDLRLEAIGDVFTTGWRLGMDTAEIETFLDEARQLARSRGKRELEVHVLSSFALSAGNGGEVRRYYDLAAEAAGLLDDRSSAEVVSAVRLHTSYSAVCLGRLKEALEEVEKLIQAAEGDHQVGQTTMGIPLWSLGTHLSSHILCELGRLDDSLDAVRRAEALLESEPQTEVFTWCGGDYVRLARMAGEVPPYNRTDWRNRTSEGLEYCEKVSSEFARVTALTYLGLAHGLAGDWASARATLFEATDFATKRGVQLQELAMAHAWHAWACHGAGDFEQARDAATKAIDWAMERGLDYQEALGRLERGKAVRELLGVAAEEAIEEDLRRLSQLIETTGALSLLPQYLEERGRLEGVRGSDPRPGLQEALARYREIGAGGHSARVAAELG